MTLKISHIDVTTALKKIYIYIYIYILSKKALFFEKKKSTQKFITPSFLPFLSVLYQSKALRNFQKSGQHLIAGGIKGLD